MKISKKGNILIEVIIAALLVGIVTASLLNYNTFSHNMLIRSKDDLIVMNVLDSVMTNFERDASPATWLDTGDFIVFASPINLVNLNNMPDGKGARIQLLLNQLRNWSITYRITTNQGAVYRDRLIVLRITWDDPLDDPLAETRTPLTKEIFSIFTARTW